MAQNNPRTSGSSASQASGIGERVREGVEDAREAIEHGYDRATGAIARHPSTSVAAGFGLGLGIGVLLALVLTQREESYYERYMPDALRDIPDHLRGLADRARHLPETLANYIPGR